MAAMRVWKDVRSPHAVHSRVRPGGLRPLQARAPHGPCAAQSRGSQGKFRPLRASVSRGLSLSTRASFWSTGTARTRRMIGRPSSMPPKTCCWAGDRTKPQTMRHRTRRFPLRSWRACSRSFSAWALPLPLASCTTRACWAIRMPWLTTCATIWKASALPASMRFADWA